MKVFGGVFLAIIAIVGMVLWSGYNSLVSLDASVVARMGEIQVQEQRRGDLVPNLVSTVQGYAKHEREVFEGVAKARAEVGKFTVNVDPSTLVANPQKMQQFLEAQQGFMGALSRLIAVSERYPELKANEGFVALQKQLEGTENRIAVARRNYVLAVKEYNQSIRKFPSVLYAGSFGFAKKPEFEAPENSRVVPVVKFN